MNATVHRFPLTTGSSFPRIPKSAAWAIAVVFALGATMSLPAPAAAQLNATGTLEGNVTELDGGALADATVTAKKQVSGDVWNYFETRTDGDGTYSIPGLGSGEWNVTVQKDGFRTQQSEVDVGVGATVAHDAALAPLLVYFYRGTLVSGENESPIVGAKARIESYDDNGNLRTREATSDADGKFTLRLFSGQNNVIVTKSGFGTSNDWVWSPGADVERTIYMHTVPPQTAHIVGTVIDGATGDAIEAWVELSTDYSGGGGGCCYAYDSMSFAPEPYPYYGNYNSTATDEDGNFEFWAYPGNVQLQANRAGHLVAIERITLAEDGTYEVTLSLVKLPERTVTISGRVTDATTGDPIQGASVSVQVPAMADYAWASTDGDGRYSVDVRAGYTLIEVSMYGWCCVVYSETVSAEDVESDDATSSDNTSSATGSATTTSGASKMMPPVAHTPGKVYFPVSMVLTTEDGDDESVNVALKPKPSAKTTLLGYVVDTANDKAIANARVSIQNHATGDWGEAVTDANGSYKFMAYGGYHTLRVTVSGFLPYAMNVDLPSSGSERVDLDLTAGEQVWEGWWTPGSGGGCGYGYPCSTTYAEGQTVGYESAGSGGMAPMMTSAPADGRASSDIDEKAESQSLVGSGGGLPAYDPSDKGETFGDGSNEAPTPTFGIVLLVGTLAALVGARGRRTQ